MTAPNLEVSDHAVLRYLERVGGFAIEKLRSELVARISAERIMGSPYIPIDGIVFVVRDNGKGPVVTTVLQDNGPRKPRKRRKKSTSGRPA